GGRVPGGRATEGCGDRDRGASDRAAAALPADVARDRRLELVHDHVPDPDRPRPAVPGEGRRLTVRRCAAARESGGRRRWQRRESTPRLRVIEGIVAFWKGKLPKPPPFGGARRCRAGGRPARRPRRRADRRTRRPERATTPARRREAA